MTHCQVNNTNKTIKILRYEAENGEVEVLETWVVKQQPKQAGPQIHIDPHPKSTQVHIAVGRQLAITESAMMGNVRIRRALVGGILTINQHGAEIPSIMLKFPNWNEPISFQRISTRREGKKGDLYTVYDQIFPFEPPYATTFNQVQGLTLESILIDTADEYLHPAAFYCAASRVQTGDGLFVTSLNPDPTKLTSVIRADRTVVEQIKSGRICQCTSVLSRFRFLKF